MNEELKESIRDWIDWLGTFALQKGTMRSYEVDRELDILTNQLVDIIKKVGGKEDNK